MSSTPPSGGRLLVEPLEARIAPTGLIAIANDPLNSGTADNYVTYAKQPSTGHLGFVPASQYLGASAPANLFAIKLTGDNSGNGDKLLIFNPTTGFTPNNPFLQAADKTLVAFFQDKNGDGQVQNNELVGLSLTKNSSVIVNGSVNGDIVTNLSKDGSTVNLTGVGKQGFAIAGLAINNGNVTGNILAGGNINNVTVTGNVTNILAGTATNGVAYNFTGNAGTVTGTIVEGAFPVAKLGASINGLSVTSLSPGDTIHAGDGGLGAVGGSVTGLSVLADTGAFNVIAGNGGLGNATVKGGIGGDVSGVTIVGVASTVNNALINIHAGNGGENDAFKGGTGGSVIGVATGFNLGFNTATNQGISSADSLTQNILVHGGDGGVGLKGGAGGDVSGSSIFSAAPDDGVVTNGVANAEIQVIAGHGGLPITADQGHGGKGGNVSQVNAEDLNLDANNVDGTVTYATDSVLVQGGDGGAGKDGGSLNGLTVLGASLTVNAGNGADGIKTGGPGGNVNTVVVSNLSNLFTHQLAINAGQGGTASGGAGGAGGSISTVTMLDSDLFDVGGQAALVINGGTHGNGGVGNNGTGGAGGTVNTVQLTNSNASGLFGTALVRSGVGGDGSTGGGDGGSVGTATTPFQMFGLGFRYAVTAGAGGNVLGGGAGAGGAGGSLDTVGFSSVGTVNQIALGQALTDALDANFTAQTGTATAGVGGTGTTHGGLGGSLSGVNLRASYDVSLTAGAGGAGGSGAGGDGGGVTASTGVSLGGSVAIVAGSGAVKGSAATNGGAITAAIVSAQTNITMTAGSGGVGGAGGDILSSGTTPNPLYYNPYYTSNGSTTTTLSNFGNVTITAGAGSSANGVAGQGGSVRSFNGSIGLGGSGDFTNFDTHLTAITAGAGGGGDGQTASGAGGVVDQLQLTGNNADLSSAQVVLIDGGNAGQAAGAKVGGAGGGVSNATIYNLDTGTTVQHIAAGDGATALKHGGNGGTVTEIHVGRPGDAVADIGVRSGAAFGYDPGSAGGLFAGVAGTFTKTTGNNVAKFTNGVNGDVTNITANAIASIVAGKTSTIHLVHIVDGIDLEGSTRAAVDASGAFTNFATANIVGSVQDPTRANASAFQAGDGLVAAANFTQNRDFFPEAVLTYNVRGVLQFADPQFGTPPAANQVAVVSTTIPVSYSL